MVPDSITTTVATYRFSELVPVFDPAVESVLLPMYSRLSHNALKNLIPHTTVRYEIVP